MIWKLHPVEWWLTGWETNELGCDSQMTAPFFRSNFRDGHIAQPAKKKHFLPGGILLYLEGRLPQLHHDVSGSQDPQLFGPPAAVNPKKTKKVVLSFVKRPILGNFQPPDSNAKAKRKNQKKFARVLCGHSQKNSEPPSSTQCGWLGVYMGSLSDLQVDH